MAETVNLFGSQVKKGYVIAGGAVVVLAVGYGWYRNRQAGASAAATQATATDTTGTSSTDAGIDPATGYPYGSAADTEALAQMSGGYGGYGYGGGGGGGYYGGGGSGGGGYTTNGQWAQAAESYLVGTVGGSADTVAAALGKYITGQPVTQDQVDVIEQAIAFTGYPPVNGPNGDPPGFVLQQGGGGGGTIGGYQAFAPGGKSLAQLATPPYAPKGITAAELEKMNPGVYRKYGSKPLPAGTGYYIPREPAPSSA